MRWVSIFTYGQIVVRRTCYVEIGDWIYNPGSVQDLPQVLEESVYPGFHSAPNSQKHRSLIARVSVMRNNRNSLPNPL
jgi:hypothetical protein